MKKIIMLLTSYLFLSIWFAFSQEFDLNRFNEVRLKKVNELRAKEWIWYGYNLNYWLSKAAKSWSDYSSSIGSMSHRKYASKAYYDYKLIQKYTEDQWVKFSPKAGTKVVENIGRWIVKCKEDDCTDEILKATESTWKFFLSEKWKVYAPHYKSMISSHYTDAWFWVSVNWKTWKYFFTAYYSVPTSNSDTGIDDWIVTLKRNPRIIRKKK